MTLTKRLQYFSCLLMLAGLVACSAKPGVTQHDDIHLTATLDTPTDITLTWSKTSPDVAGIRTRIRE